MSVTASVSGKRLTYKNLIGEDTERKSSAREKRNDDRIIIMAEVKLKIYLNKGREGIPTQKLPEFTKEVDKFLRMFCNDLQIEKPEWIAEEFKNGSFIYSNRLASPVPGDKAVQAIKALEQITNPKTKAATLNYGIRNQTYGQFAKIAAPADKDETIGFGVYTEKGTFSKRILSKKRAAVIETQIKQRINKYCGYRGTISAFYPGSNKIHITDKATNQVVNCIFTSQMYPRIIKALNRQNAVVNVEGWLRQELSDDSAYLHIKDLIEMPTYQDGDLEKFFGCDPYFTGDLTTEEYMNEIRDDELDSLLVS